ncbi:MAG: sigma-54 dependent transcriptional regulator [Bacteroidota bacterium]|nr:sigma-54 dependent transcriptional regulator [Bacteroidota bacterium]
MAKHRIFLIVQEDSERKVLQQKLQKAWGYDVQTFSHGDAALEALDAPPDVALLERNVTGVDGEDVFRELRRQHPWLPVILLTDEPDINAADIMKSGALDIIAMPVDTERLEIALLGALRHSTLAQEALRLREELEERISSKHIIADSREMQLVLRLIEKLNGREVPVLITGENGSGREDVARTIHLASPRNAGPFLTVSCANIPADELAGALFGFESPSMHPTQRSRGALEEADGGTVYISELAALNADLQAALHAVIQRKSLRRIGGNTDYRTNVRLIASTSENLKERVRAGTFRDDLYYIFASYPIHVPPLRERGADIMRLAEYFLRKTAEKNKLKIRGFSREAVEAMYHYPWPGNVRELESSIERSVLLSGGGIVSLQHLPVTVHPFKDASMELDTEGRLFHDDKIVSLDRIKEQAVRRAIEISRGNLAHTARELDISRSTLYKLIEKYGIKL